MKYWMKTSFNNIFNVCYEDLVSNADKTIKDLWNFCNLSGQYNEERRKKHFAQTASKQQVTRDIYKTSINKSEFEGYKDSFFKDLEAQREFWASIK